MINITVLVKQPMLACVLNKAAMLIIEAKSSVLQELAIGSRESEHIATCTGTDQMIVAAAIDESKKTLTSASGHLNSRSYVASFLAGH